MLKLTLLFFFVYLFLGAIAVAVLDPDAAKRVFHSGVDLEDADKRAIEESLVLFNKILTDIFVTGGDPKLIDEMPASKNVKHFIFRDIGFLGGKGLLLVLDQATMEIMSFELERDDVLARTFEEWNYSYQETGTRKPVSEVKGMGQVYLYRLRKEEGSWRIVSWDLENAPPPEKRKEFLH